ncbi:hypothetical protein PRIPAC_73423 [Pristionchus pacificus]|uniref:SET domain-containing protein n=1 Tax=Pristionchus pacificus TaxID=54126 RepID=A0A2A6C7K6_PRIPA|nr:hypothetical protein PRIPAC_73423 [Pristionchus pacificus]|eukprot:PDM74192.1 SET domain-containing protein [Pristionchus pacificus]
MAPPPVIIPTKSARVRKASQSTEREKKIEKREEAGPSTSAKRDRSKDKSAKNSPKSPPSSRRNRSEEKSLKRSARSPSAPTKELATHGTGLNGTYWPTTPISSAPRSAKLSASSKIENKNDTPTSADEEPEKKSRVTFSIEGPSSSKSSAEMKGEKRNTRSSSADTPRASRSNGETAKKDRDQSKSPKTVTPKSNGETTKLTLKTKDHSKSPTSKDDKSKKNDLKVTPKMSKLSLECKKDRNESKSPRKNNNGPPKSPKKIGELSKKGKDGKPAKNTLVKSRRSLDGDASTSKEDNDAGTVKKRRKKLVKKPEDRKRNTVSESSESYNSDASEKEKDPYEQEKEWNQHYPGRIYALNNCKPKEKVEGEKFQTRVERVLSGDKETKADWNERLVRTGRISGGVFEFDIIVGCTDPKASWVSGEAQQKKFKILIVYKGMVRGEWRDFCPRWYEFQPLIREWVNMQIQFDKVEIVLREECARRGQRYEDLYPARYLPTAGSKGTWGNTPLERLRTLQMARQYDMNDTNREDGVPPNYVADWSGVVHDFVKSTINTFKFTNYPIYSRRVEKKLQSGNIERSDEHCKAECPCSNPSLPGSCTCHPKKTKFNRRAECGGSCRCDAETCSNRIVQRGRQMPVIIMRHHVKGWSSRLFVDIKEGDFVHEYVGEIVTYHENRKMDQTYALDQSDSLWDPSQPANRKDQHKARKHNKGKTESGYCHRALVVNGLNFANEARFNAHGCKPKLKTVVTYVDRQSYGLHRTAFFAGQDMRAGEELTWNYHGEGLEIAMNNGEGFPSGILPCCDCGEPDCPITKNTKPYVDEDKEPEDDRDSFLDSDEEKELERELLLNNNRTSRMEKRDQRKSSNAENESNASSTPPRSAPLVSPKGMRRQAYSPQL